MAMRFFLLLLSLTLSCSAQLTLRNAAYAPLLVPAAAGAWVPSNEGTVLMDLDASVVNIPTGTATNYWPDSSGNGYGASQTTAGYQPKFLDATQGTNGFKCFLFDGTDDFMNVSNVFGSITAATAFLVVCHDTDTDPAQNSNSPWRIGGSGQVSWFPHTSGIYDDFGSNTRRTDGGTYSAYVDNNKPYIITATASASQWNLYINNTNVITQGAQTVAWDSSPTISGNSTWVWKGVMYRLLIYSEALDSTHRGNVITQLKAIYGTP